MIYDFINLDKNSTIPLYKQLYSSIRKAIENNGLTEGDRLVSIRALSKGLGISKTTVEAAYSQLCAEGYIKNSPQRGYFIQGQVLKRKEKSENFSLNDDKINSNYVKYDFSSKSVSVDSTGIRLWKKYVKSYLNRDYILSSYGDPQGECSLRRALSFYSYSVRGVIATEENIVIGAGTQSLLYLICGLLRQHGTKIAVENGASMHFIKVFNDCGFEVVKIDSDGNGMRLDLINKEKPNLLLINPSGSLANGDRMKMERRYELIQWCKKHNRLIIEDDYNGEMVYYSRSIPAMQCSSPQSVIYLGSFSKLLLPSVRIGYMVLPDFLSKEYTAQKTCLNQTASKIEQLALADYISDGQLERHLRRLKRVYSEKGTIIKEKLYENLGEVKRLNAVIKLFETSLAFEIVVEKAVDIERLNLYLNRESISIISAETDDSKKRSVIKIGFSGITDNGLDNAVELLCGIIIESIR